MLKRQRTGSVVCRSCGLLVGVNDEECYNCGVRNPGLWGYASILRRLGQDLGFMNLVTVVCLILYVASLAVNPSGIGSRGFLGFLSPGNEGLFLFGASGSVPVFLYGRWWTLLSAGWLHGGLLHIGFNMLWVRQLAPVTSEIYGPGRTVIIYTVSSAMGFLMSSGVGTFWAGGYTGGAPFTVGASAAIFGLLGALVYSGRRGGSGHISKQAQTYAIFLGLFGFIMPHVDNWAHAGGFLGGYLIARWLDPMLPERMNHIVAAVLCLAATFGAILLSVVTGLRYIQ